MDIKKNKGFAAIIAYLFIVVIGALIGGGIYEVHKAREKNTAKAIVTTTTEVAVAKQASDALALKNAQDDAARVALEKAHQDQVQAIAGYASGAKIALESDPNPSLDSKIADLMVGNVLDVSGPATPAQVVKFTAIIKELVAANAQLTADNANLKNVNLITIQSLNTVTVENAQIKGNLALTEQKAKTSEDAKDAAVKQVTIANNAAEASAKQIDIINISWTQRVKAWFLGLGLFGIAGVLVICFALPLLANAFPVFEPAAKNMTGWLLGLWHKLAAKAVSIEQAAHATTKATLTSTQTQLAVEQAAHAVTKSVLNTTQQQVVSIATTPTVADQLVANLATPSAKAIAPMANPSILSSQPVT